MVKKSHRKKIEDKRMWRNKKNIPEEESLSEKIRAISLFGLVYDPSLEGLSLDQGATRIDLP